jgi:hypothetical protein
MSSPSASSMATSSSRIPIVGIGLVKGMGAISKRASQAMTRPLIRQIKGWVAMRRRRGRVIFSSRAVRRWICLSSAWERAGFASEDHLEAHEDAGGARESGESRGNGKEKGQYQQRHDETKPTFSGLFNDRAEGEWFDRETIEQNFDVLRKT